MQDRAVARPLKWFALAVVVIVGLGACGSSESQKAKTGSSCDDVGLRKSIGGEANVCRGGKWRLEEDVRVADVTTSSTSTSSTTTTTLAPTTTTTAAPPPPPPPPQTSPPVVAPPTSVYFANCTEARNAGAAPVYRGDPGYGSHLDRDGDGVGCET